MRVASLFAVFVLARVATVVGHQVTLSWWTPIAYLWQDALVVLVFGAIEFSLPGPLGLRLLRFMRCLRFAFHPLRITRACTRGPQARGFSC